MRADLPHLHSVHRKDRKGNVQYTDYYADRNNHKHSRINSEYGTRAFYREYFDYWENKKYNVEWLITEYLNGYVISLGGNTQKQYKNQLKKLQILHTDSKKIQNLKKNILQTGLSFVNDFDFKKDVERLADTLPTVTANIFMRTLSACLQWGYDERKHSVSDHALKYTRKRARKDDDIMRTSVAWTKEDWKRATNCFKPTDPFYKILVIMRFTGMRIGDASRLKWDQIDFAEKTVTLCPSKNGKVIGTIIVPLFPEFEQYLKNWDNNHTFIVCTQNGSVFMPNCIDQMRYEFKNTMTEKYGEEYYIQPHGLRKAIVVDYIDAGLTISQISSVLGWSHRTTQTMLDNHYFIGGNLQVAKRAMAQVIAAQSQNQL